MATKKILIQIEANAAEANAVLKKVKTSLDGVAGANVKMSKSAKGANRETGLHNAILMETSRLASDVSYGFTAVANNLGQLIDLFKMTSNSASGVTGALKNLFKIQSLFIIGIQLLISFMPKIIKHFKDKAKEARAVKNALIEGTQAIQGQVKALETYQDILNSTNMNLNDKQKLLARVVEETKLENLELDDNNKLSDKSNKLIKDKIRLLVLESQANVIKNQIQTELTKRAKELAEIEEDKNGKIAKATDFIDRNTSSVQKNTKTLMTGAKVTASVLGKNAESIPILGGIISRYNKLSKALGLYSKDVNSAEAVESRNNKAREKSNKVTAESEIRVNALITQFRKLTFEMMQLTDANEGYKESQFDTNLFDKIENDNLKMENLTDKFNAKSIENERVRKRAELDAQEKAQMDSINSSEAYETKKEDARIATQKYYKRQREALTEKEADQDRKLRNASLKDLGGHLNKAAGLFAEHTAANKALRISGAVIDTYAAADTALASSPPPLNFIQAAAVIAAGLANVKKILQVKVPGAPSSVGTGTMNVSAPDFNVVGQSATSQLVGAVQNQFGTALRAYVVSGDISSAQELDRKINTTSVIG